jgi:hypothetical protein
MLRWFFGKYRLAATNKDAPARGYQCIGEGAEISKSAVRVTV